VIRRTTRRIVTTLAFVVASLATIAAAQEYALDVSVATSAKAATFQIGSDGGQIPLTLLSTGKAPAGPITVSVTPFLSEAGERIEPQLSAGTQRGKTITLKTPADLVSCDLVVPALNGPGPFTGSLIIRVGKAAATRQVVAISSSTPSRPAALQVMPENEVKAFEIGMPMWRSHGPAPPTLDPSLGPTFEIRMRDGAEKWPVTQVTPGPVAVVKSPDGFAVSQHIAFYDSQRRLVTFPRTIAASGETLTMQLVNLEAGEYSATIPFHAANGAIEPRRFTFTANVKHHWFWAVLCLSFALLLSYGASKLVDIRNERLRLTRRIETVFPAWLESEEQTLALVWISSIQTQARHLSRTWLLPSLDTIHARLDKVEALLKPITTLRRVREEIRRSQGLPDFAKRRALTTARRIADRLDYEMDQATLNEQVTDISKLRDWIGPSPERPYAEDLAVSVNQLLANVELAAIPASGQSLVRTLVTELKQPLPTKLDELNAREQQYAKLKILWERRNAPEFPELVTAAGTSVGALFKAADTSAWRRLKDAKARTLSHSSDEPVDAHEPMVFEFSTGDTDLDDTYFVKHALRYVWHFDHKRKKDETVGRKPFSSDATTMSPRVPQYAMHVGTFHPSVTIVFEAHGQKDSQKVTGRIVTIGGSGAFNPVKGFSVGEMVQLLLAFVAAVTTGLQTFYFKSGGFGSLPDYLTLFAWGTTIDQFKNFLQKLPTATQAIQGTAVTTPVQTASPGPSGGGAGQPAGPAAANAQPVTAAAHPAGANAPAAPQQPAAPPPQGNVQGGGPAKPAPAAPQAPPDIADPPRPQQLPLNGEKI
jgi:hypothetical protein